MCMCIWGEKWLRRLGRQLRLNARSVNGKSRFQNLSGKAERVCRPTCKPSAEKAETVQDGWPEQLCLPALGSSERPTSVNKVQYNRRRRMASTLGLHMHAHAYMQSWAHLQTQCALHLWAGMYIFKHAHKRKQKWSTEKMEEITYTRQQTQLCFLDSRRSKWKVYVRIQPDMGF